MMTHSDLYPPPLTIESRPCHCNSQHDPPGLFKGSGMLTVAWQCPVQPPVPVSSPLTVAVLILGPRGAPQCSHPAGTMLLTHCQ